MSRPRTIVGADIAIVDVIDGGNNISSEAQRIANTINNATMGDLRFMPQEDSGHQPSLPVPDVTDPLREYINRYIRVRGESYMLSTESYERVEEVPRTTRGNPHNSGLSIGKDFTGRFFTILGNPDPPGGPEGVWSISQSVGTFEPPPYGGNQDWFEDENMQNTGCGSIAAANVLFYYGREWVDDNIVFAGVPTFEEFIRVASVIYNRFIRQSFSRTLTPLFGRGNTWGVWFMSTFARGLVESALVGSEIINGIKLGSQTINNSSASYDQAVNFIKTALQQDNPVVLLVTGNDYIAQGFDEIAGEDILMVEVHFVTITSMTEIRQIRITETVPGGIEVNRSVRPIEDYELRTSDWGVRRHIPSLKRMWEANTTFDETLSRIPDIPVVANHMPGFAASAARSISAETGPLHSVSLASFNLISGAPANTISGLQEARRALEVQAAQAGMVMDVIDGAPVPAQNAGGGENPPQGQISQDGEDIISPE